MQFKNTEIEYAVQSTLENAKTSIEAKEKEANELYEVCLKLMHRRKVYSLYATKDLLDIFKAAAYLYDLYLEQGSIASHFKLRDCATPFFAKIDVSQQDMIFQMCESSLGEDSPIPLIMPQKGYPDDLFADAVFILQWLNSSR